MKRFLLTTFCFWILSVSCNAQFQYWTGGGIAGQWSDPNNWSSLRVPDLNDDIYLDNGPGAPTTSYVVNLPGGNITTEIYTLSITPTGNNTITLILPSSNIAQPGFETDGPGNSIILDKGAIFRNSSGASATPTISVGIFTSDSMQIKNGGIYEHNNIRSASLIADYLSIETGTEKGIFWYHQPSLSPPTLPSTIALQGKTFGTLEFGFPSAASIYTATGGSLGRLKIRGDLIVDVSATLNLNTDSSVYVAGDFIVNGTFSRNPSVGTINRNLVFNGTANQTISGSGIITFGPNFRNIKINPNAIVTLAKDINLNSTDATDSLIIYDFGRLNMGIYKVTGAGKFVTLPKSYLSLGDPNGISFLGASGNVQTTTRTFDIAGRYEYNGTSGQITGDGLPAQVSKLIINNRNGVTLKTLLLISDSLTLIKGKLFTGTVSAPSAIPFLLASAKIESAASSYSNLLGSYPNNIGTDSSYIVGPIKKTMTLGQTFAFPVGNFYHRPIILKNATGDFEVNYVQQTPYGITNGSVMDNVLHHVSHIEYWMITSANGTANIETSFYDPNSGSVTVMSDLRVGQHDGTKWNNIGGISTIGSPGSNGSVTSGAVSINSPFPIPFTLASITSENPLPIFLKYFRLRTENPNNFIEWGIENDADYKEYILERSFDGINFIPLNDQLSKSANGLAWYNFKEKVLQTAFYRLKLIANDGKLFVSNILEAKRIFNYSVYPNPASKEITIKISPSSSISTIEIVNSSGQVIKSVQVAASAATINIQSLQKGIYFIRLQNQNSTIVQRFFKR